jgi:hypothetical protein
VSDDLVAFYEAGYRAEHLFTVHWAGLAAR